ncbi:MAG: tetratricopeptide repeat protein [Chromatiales bacterium]|jgi:tetratricopeptide (TPR) repeat protein
MYTNPFASHAYLVIDDFGDMRNMLKGIMRMLGATDIDSASNGKDAIAAMQRKKYDVVLCDYNLGVGKDGQQVLEEARQRKLISMATVYFMVTAENTRSMVMGAMEYGPDGYLSKPFSKDLIKSRIEKVLSRKSELKEIYQALDAKRYDSAIELLDAKLKDQPKNSSELSRLKADVCLRAGRHDDAITIYEQALAVRDLPWARLGLGKALFGKKQYGQAAEIFQQLNQSQPDLPVVLDWLAKCHQMLGDLEQAKADVQAAIELSPKAILRQQMLGDLGMQTRDYGLAGNAYKEMVKQGRNSVFNHPSLYARLAKSQTQSDQHDAALQSVSEMKKQFDGDSNVDFYAAVTEAQVYHNQGDAAASAAAMHKADELYQTTGDKPDDDMTLELAKAASRLGDDEKARALLKQVVQNNHEDDGFLQNVTAAMVEVGMNDDPQEFVSGLKKEIVEMNNRGVKLLQQGELDDAMQLFESAAEKMPGNRVLNLNAARVSVMLMEKNGAEPTRLERVDQYLHRLRQIDPDGQALPSLTARLDKLAASI